MSSDKPQRRRWPLLSTDTPLTADEMAAANQAAIPRGVKMGTECSVHHHREWVPIELHHVWPLGMGGPDTAANKISVCCNGHYSIHACLDLHIRHGEDPPWELMQHFGPKIRERAWHGWNAAGRPRAD